MEPLSNVCESPFAPHIWLKVERDIPSPIFPVAMMGVPRLLQVPLPCVFALDKLHDYFLAHYATLMPVKGGLAVHCFGRCMGYYYHYELGKCIEFDLDGHEIGHHETVPPHYGAETSFTIGGQS